MASEDSNLDSILDAALREYANREPRAGFEGRILRRVQSAPPARRLWPKLLPALAVIPLAIAILHRDPPRAQPLPPQISRTVEAPPPAMSPPQPVVKRRKLRERKTFAEPEPLTAEERALLRFVQSYPEQAREALSLSAQIEKITIEPLKIEELQ